MKKFKRYLYIGVAVMMLFLTGCGAELYELTAEEEDLIVHSAAYYLAKHNIHHQSSLAMDIHSLHLFAEYYVLLNSMLLSVQLNLLPLR